MPRKLLAAWLEGRIDLSMIKNNLLLNKRIKVALLVIYTVLVVYLLFFGFGRSQLDMTHQTYRFQIVSTGIPLWFPKHL